MLTEVERFRERLRKEEAEKYKDIYAECDKRGLSREYAKDFYYRMIQFPIEQTKTVILLYNKDASKDKTVGKKKLKEWKTYLEIMVKTHPKHEKAEDFKKGIKLIEELE